MKSQIDIISSVLQVGHFYLDPGSGSFLLQILLAALLGSAFAIKMYWKKIKSFFVKTPKTDEDEETDEKIDD
jgi:hypothetical protein